MGPPVDVASSLHNEWDKVGLVGVLRRLDCGVSLGCPSRGGLAALVDVALGPRAHDTDVEDPRGATLVYLDVATPQVSAGLRVRYTCTYNGALVMSQLSDWKRAH